MIKFYIPHSENSYSFQNKKILHQNSLIIVANTCERLNDFINKRESMTVLYIHVVKKSYNKTVINFFFLKVPTLKPKAFFGEGGGGLSGNMGI